MPPLLVSEPAPGRFKSTINLTLKHGVRRALEHDRTAISPPRTASATQTMRRTSHSSTWAATATRSSPPAERIDTEVVRVARPIARATTPDSGPLRHRVRHGAPA